jgi:hypothetical protein
MFNEAGVAMNTPRAMLSDFMDLSTLPARVLTPFGRILDTIRNLGAAGTDMWLGGSSWKNITAGEAAGFGADWLMHHRMGMGEQAAGVIAWLYGQSIESSADAANSPRSAPGYSAGP